MHELGLAEILVANQTPATVHSRATFLARPTSAQIKAGLSRTEVGTTLEGLEHGTANKVEEQCTDLVKGSPSALQKTRKEHDLCLELRLKIQNDLEKRSSLWIGFVNPEEEREFIKIEELLDSVDENATSETYFGPLTKIKKMTKHIKARFKEDLNRDASLKKLQGCIGEMQSRHDLTPQQKSDLDKEEGLLCKKLKKQQSLKKYENSILRCQEMDEMRKKLEKPSYPPVVYFSSTPKEDIYFNPARNFLVPFIGHMRNRLVDHEQFGKILDSYLLAYQTNCSSQPPKWLLIHLPGTGDNKTAIYMRSDNCYFSGYESKYGERFQFAPQNKSEHARLIEGAILISCSADYPSLMNYQRLPNAPNRVETEERLLDLDLKLDLFLEDIDILSNYHDPLPADEIERFQKALTRVCIIICEVCRIIELPKHVGSGWVLGVKLTSLLLRYMWKWQLTSQALHTWLIDKNRVLTDDLKREILMNCPEEISPVLFLLLNAQGPGIVLSSAAQHGDDGQDKPGSDQGGPGDNYRPPRSDKGSYQGPPQGPASKTNSHPRAQHPAPSSGSGKHDLTHGEGLMAGSPSLGLLIQDKDKGMPGYSGSEPLQNLVPPMAGPSRPVVGSMTGLPLIEVFSVTANFPFVGSIVAFDGRWCTTIYQCDDWNKSSSKFEANRNLWMQNGKAAIDFKDNLILTGPCRAFTASGGFGIQVYVPARRRKPGEMTEFSWNCRDTPTIAKPSICTIKTKRGCLFVTWAVLNEALEGVFTIRMQVPHVLLRFQDARVYGSIIARVDHHEVSSVLFWRSVDDPMVVSLCDDFFVLPLTRCVVPVPLKANICIVGRLHFLGPGISTTINHHIWVKGEEEIHTKWHREGVLSNAVQLSLRPIF